MLLRLTNVQPPPQSGFPTPDASDKKFNSRLVVPTFFRNEPFGEHVEGLSRCGDKGYAIETAVQSRDAEEASMAGGYAGVSRSNHSQDDDGMDQVYQTDVGKVFGESHLHWSPGKHGKIRRQRS